MREQLIIDPDKVLMGTLLTVLLAPVLAWVAYVVVVAIFMMQVMGC